MHARPPLGLERRGEPAAIDALAKAELESPTDVDGELVPYLVQYAAPKLPLVRRILAAIWAALYRLGVKMQLTPDDVRVLAVSALKARAKAVQKVPSL